MRVKTIYAIPGLGTTKELFRNIFIPGYELKVLNWPEPEKAISLKDYAKKFLPQIDQTHPVILLGVSFGGMLCTELAELIAVKKVFLISSSKNRLQFPGFLKLLRYFPVYRLVPDKAIRAIAATKRKFIGFEKSFEPVFVSMISQMPEKYFSYCIGYIVNWRRKTNAFQPIQIHGTTDKMLSHRNVTNCYEIKNGSHAMVLSNAAEINAILNKELNE